MERRRRTVSLKALLADIRQGYDDAFLAQKYELSEKHLRIAFDKLIQMAALTRAELEARRPKPASKPSGPDIHTVARRPQDDQNRPPEPSESHKQGRSGFDAAVAALHRVWAHCAALGDRAAHKASWNGPARVNVAWLLASLAAVASAWLIGGFVANSWDWFVPVMIVLVLPTAVPASAFRRHKELSAGCLLFAAVIVSWTVCSVRPFSVWAWWQTCLVAAALASALATLAAVWLIPQTFGTYVGIASVVILTVFVGAARPFPIRSEESSIAWELADSSSAVRVQGVHRLAALEPFGSVERLLDLGANDRAPDVRQAAKQALAGVNQPDTPAKLVAVAADRSRMTFVRVVAVEVLDLGKAPAGVNSVINILAEGTEPVELRCAAATALARSGDTRAVPALVRGVETGAAPVQEAAVDALETFIGDERALQALLGALKAQNMAVHQRATAILGRHANERTVERLARVLREGSGQQPQLAAEVLGSIGGPRAVTALAGFLHNSPRGAPKGSDKLVTCVVQALARIGGSQATEGLADACKTLGGEERRAAFDALDRLGTDHAVRSLLRLCKDETAESSVIEGAVFTLLRSKNPKNSQSLTRAIQEDKQIWHTIAKNVPWEGHHRAVARKDLDNNLWKNLYPHLTAGLDKWGNESIVNGLLKVDGWRSGELRTALAKWAKRHGYEIRTEFYQFPFPR